MARCDCGRRCTGRMCKQCATDKHGQDQIRTTFNTHDHDHDRDNDSDEDDGDEELATDGGQYLTNGELREEIVHAVGGDPTRYGVDSDRGLQKADVLRIATQLQPTDSNLTLHECDLEQLYKVACKWAGGEYHPNAGNPWGINRPNLKCIHRAVDATDPREIPLATDGGRDVDESTNGTGQDDIPGDYDTLGGIKTRAIELGNPVIATLVERAEERIVYDSESDGYHVESPETNDPNDMEMFYHFGILTGAALERKYPAPNQNTHADTDQDLATDGGQLNDAERTQVGHCKADETDVYAGRGTAKRDLLDMNPGARGWLGNPFTTDDYTREESIRRFRKIFEWRLESDPEFRNAVRDLAGKTLGCWCQRLDEDEPACHAEVIAEHANRLNQSRQPETYELRTDGGRDKTTTPTTLHVPEDDAVVFQEADER